MTIILFSITVAKSSALGFLSIWARKTRKPLDTLDYIQSSLLSHRPFCRIQKIAIIVSSANHSIQLAGQYCQFQPKDLQILKLLPYPEKQHLSFQFPKFQIRFNMRSKGNEATWYKLLCYRVTHQLVHTHLVLMGSRFSIEGNYYLVNCWISPVAFSSAFESIFRMLLNLYKKI